MFNSLVAFSLLTNEYWQKWHQNMSLEHLSFSCVALEENNKDFHPSFSMTKK